MKLDVSIGQRMAIGFGLMLAILAGALYSVSQAHKASARAQSAYARHIVPLAERAGAVERSLYRLGIALRNFLLDPHDATGVAYRTAVRDVRSAMHALHEAPKYDVSDALYRELAALVAAYLLQAEQAADARRRGTLREGAERALSRARERAVDSIHDFREHQAMSSRAALAGIAVARDTVTRDLHIASAVAALWLLLIGFLTARSVSRPTRELVKVARGFETGLWKPALAWAPAAGAPPIEPRDEMAKLRRALGAAAAALERREARLYADAQVAAATASSLDKSEIGEHALLAVAEHVASEACVLYLCAQGDEDMLEPVATYALDGEVERVRIGVGIPGEAAKIRRPVVVRDIPPDTPLRVKLGFEEVLPRAIAAIPLVFRQELVGVLLVASLRDIDEADVSFLRAAAAQLAIGVRNATAHDEVQRLLTRVSDQNTEIQAQNEEIQAQAEEIRAQNEQLREQADELRAHAEELRERAGTLQQADEHKNHFLSVLAHELRNPVAAISNALSVLQAAAPGTEEGERAAAVVQRQVRHLGVLIEDLIDIARIAQGKVRVERTRVDIGAIINGCLNDQEPALHERGLVLERAVPPGPVWVHGDETRLTQMVSNLLVNAAKFSDSGKRVTVSVRTDAAREEVAIEVADEGAGLDPSFLPQLFDAFTQSAETLTRTSGLGLGLALVKAVTELHGGRVEAHSEGQGKGARFVVTLPLLDGWDDVATTGELQLSIEAREP